MIFDGEIDTDWVENLNSVLRSVLDDNKKLTLVTGESIPLNERMRVIFETNDLSNCSPATISRCGLVFMDDDSI